MKQSKKCIFSTALFVLAGIFAAFFLWALIVTGTYIGDLMYTGDLEFFGNEYDIFDFVLSSCGSYLFYSAALSALALLLRRIAPVKITEPLEESDDSEDMLEETEEITDTEDAPASDGTIPDDQSPAE